jgi:hypothetical protein
MSALTCSQCNSPLALADAVCPACRTPVPAEARRALMLGRADALAGQERWGEAARSLAGLPVDGQPVAEVKRVLRLRALWLQKSGAPGALDEAEATLAQVVALDQADDLSHHAWMDLLKRRGRLDAAKAHYQGRLAQDPLDAVAKRQMSVLRLSEDMLLAPAPKLALGTDPPKGLFAKMIHPTRSKMLTAGSVVVFCLGSMIWGLFNAPATPVAPAAAAAAAPDSLSDSAAIALATSSSGPGSWVGGGNSQMMSVLTDPWINGIQLLLALAYLWWGWKERRG